MIKNPLTGPREQFKLGENYSGNVEHKYMSSEAAADLITLVNVDDSLGRVTDYEDHHHPGQQGYHCLIPPVSQEKGYGDNAIVGQSPFS